jgi:hypothetical protein
MTNRTPFPVGAPSPAGRPGWWSRLTLLQQAAVVGAALLLPCCGGVAAVGALTGDPGPRSATAPAVERAAGEPAETASTRTATNASSRPATASPTTGAARPVVTKKIVKEREPIPFRTRTIRDGNLAKGEQEVRTRGANGTRTITYEVTLTDGAETARKKIGSVVSKKPVTRVVAVGTQTASTDGDCNPNYSPCVPNASDVDCAGGSGNGPEYVDGPIRVIGDDPYDLDRDGDGIACDT